MSTDFSAHPFLNNIICGDSAFILKQLDSESVDLVITSPPYFNQRNYNNAEVGIGNEPLVENYLAALLEVLQEVVRVLRPDGNIVYNLGDKYEKGSLLLVPYRFAMLATEQNNLRLVNNITWVKTNPTPRQFARRLVSSTEPFFHFAKGSSYYFDRDSFISQSTKKCQTKPTSRLGQKYRALVDTSDLSKSQKELAHRHLDEVIQEVHDGKTQSFRMKIRGIHAEAFGGNEGGRKSQMDKNGFTLIRITGQPMKRDVLINAVASNRGIRHQAIYPEAIITQLIQLLCPKGGVVLDPYIGSGTTALAARKSHRHFIGIEIDPSYCKLANNRVEAVVYDQR